jgi:zinc D-Ala-D-Ala carboxypeptidase
MKLTNNFRLVEFVRSNTAEKNNIRNQIDQKSLINLVYLSIVMEEVRKLFDKKITITSGYRCKNLNRLLGSEDRSKHVEGLACDFYVDGFTIGDAFRIIKNSDVWFSKLILEFEGSGKGWIHIEVMPLGSKPKKRELYIATKINDKTVYKKANRKESDFE